MKIRFARMSDCERIAEIEEASFPKEEAADRERMEKRIKAYPECFWVLEDEEIVSYICGMSTGMPDLEDEMYENESMHDKLGCWQMIFSVATDPLKRGKGYASRVMESVIDECKKRGKAGIVLTCKERLLSFYERFGFLDEGISSSVHGRAVWHKMRLKLKGGFENCI